VQTARMSFAQSFSLLDIAVKAVWRERDMKTATVKV
jgi:hypothetical protein